MGLPQQGSSRYDSLPMSEESPETRKSSLVSWLVLVLLCVSALGGLVLLALRSG
jgi:Tfp pilus assembly protein PilN